MKNVIKRVKNFINKIFIIIRIYLVFIKDARYYLQYSLTLNANGKNKQNATILLLVHSLEKGMSFKLKKQGYGREKALYLMNCLDKYILKYDLDDTSILGLNVLDKYLNDSFSTKDENVRNRYEKILKRLKIQVKDSLGGVDQIQKPLFRISYNDLYDFYKSRRSVREFSEKDITDIEIKEAQEFAKLTPTACNRQTSYVYSYKNKSLISSILQNQNGDQGWCSNANTLFIITGKQSSFGGVYERDQIFIDGGLYAMNFVMGLHIQQIATCFKMYIRDPQKDRELRKIMNIAEDEVPIVLILAGHYLDYPITIPQSVRF